MEKTTDKVQYLQEVVGVDRDVAKRLLFEALGSVETAQKIYNESKIEEVLILRGKFYGKRRGISGLFFMVFDTGKLSLDIIDVFVTYKRNIFEINFEINFEMFKKIISGFRNDAGLESAKESNEIKDYIRKYFAPEKVMEIAGNYNSDQKNEIKTVIMQQINEAICEIPVLDLVMQKEINIIAIKKETDDEGYLPLSAVSDVGGKEPKDLKKGESVYIIIPDINEYSRFIAKTIGASNGISQIPVEREIEDIEFIPDEENNGAGSGYKVILNVADDIFGKLFIKTGERVKTTESKRIIKREAVQELEEYEEEAEAISKKVDANKLLMGLLVIMFLGAVYFVVLIVMGRS